MITVSATRLINIAAAALATSTLYLASGNGDARAANTLVAEVSISRQTMEVSVCGRQGHATPTGSYRPTRLEEMWHSRKYDNAPMPHSVFFHGGYAVRATNYVRRLGHPASHGCVRLHPDAAADFYRLVETFGPSDTWIVIVE